eukprot:1096762-Alexandrium_andersonii.AAC.1
MRQRRGRRLRRGGLDSGGPPQRSLRLCPSLVAALALTERTARGDDAAGACHAADEANDAEAEGQND